MKHCKSCGLDLPLDMFNKNKRNRDGLQFYCKECTSMQGKDYYRRNKASVNQKHRNHYYKNKEKRNEQIAKWSRENRDKRRDIDKRSYQKNREKRIEKSMQWIRDNLERHAERNQIRRAKIRDLDATFTSEEWIECKKYFANCCAYCGSSVEKLEQEHFISIENGGPYTKENMLPACKSCNSSKRDRDFYEWYPRQIFYSKQREEKIIKYSKTRKKHSNCFIGKGDLDMCMKCEIKNALKGALANAAGLKITEEVIGKATEAQLKELQAADEAEKAIKKQLQAEYKAEIAPIREKYIRRTEELLKPVFERHDEVCVEIQKDLGVTDDDDVSIDLVTGEVTKEVIKEKETSDLH